MKKRKLSLILVAMLYCVLSFFSCKTNNIVQNTSTYNSMEYALDTIVDKHYVDSVCIADTLGPYPDAWVWAPLEGYETKKDISIYGYMKSSNWTFYRVIRDGDKYRLTKRTIK